MKLIMKSRKQIFLTVGVLFILCSIVEYFEFLFIRVYLNKKLFHDIVKYTRYSVLFKYTAAICSVAF